MDICVDDYVIGFQMFDFEEGIHIVLIHRFELEFTDNYRLFRTKAEIQMNT